MRKVVAGALVAAALAWAQGARAADAPKERREAADATKSEVKQEGREARESARQTGREMQEGMKRGARPGEEKKHPLFEGKNNFDLDGKIAKVSPNSITIQREGFPDATLHLSNNTKLEVDGNKVSAQQLQRGQDVKASFNLNGDKAEAVEIKADKLEKDASKEMREQRQETQKEMGERREKAQQR